MVDHVFVSGTGLAGAQDGWAYPGPGTSPSSSTTMTPSGTKF